AVAGVHRQRLASTVHFAVDLGVLEGALHRQRNAQADVPIVGAGVDVRLQIGRQNDVHATVPGTDRPTGSNPGAGLQVRVDAAVAGLDVQRVQTAGNGDVPVARGGIDSAIQITRFDVTIAGMQVNLALGAFDGDAPVAGINVYI